MQREDSKIFQRYIIENAKKIEKFYNEIQNLNDKEKKIRKDKLMLEIINGIDTLNLHQKEKYMNLKEDIKVSKNAFFMDYLRYNSQEDSLAAVLDQQFNGNIKAYLEFVKSQN